MLSQRIILAAAMIGASAAVCHAGELFRVLVFTKTAGFRHSSIPNGVQMVNELGAEHCFAAEHTEDAAIFNADDLARFRVVIFLCTTGDILNNEQQAAFEAYIGQGGGWVGVHSAADTEYSWPFYGQLLGAYFSSHPAPQTAQIDIEDADHPSTETLPDPWTRHDEWYNFQTNPRLLARVLATLNESTYSGGTMGDDHPIIWCREFAGGRSWYTAGGHTEGSYLEPHFRRHVLGGIFWAADIQLGTVPGDANGDNQTNAADLSVLLSLFGQTVEPGAAADFNSDGVVNAADLSVLLSNFGAGCGA